MAGSSSIRRSVSGSVVPTSPIADGTVAVTAGGNSVAVVDGYAYVCSYVGGGSSVLSVVDVTNPSVPAVLGTLGGLTNLAVAAPAPPYVYLGRHGGLTVVDVSNPNAPTSVGSVALTALVDVYDVVLAGRYAFCTGGTGGGNGFFYVVDVSVPTAPVVVGSITANANLDVGQGLVVRGKYVYQSARGADRLNVIDVSDPANPSIVGFVAVTGGPIKAALSGRILYVPGYSSGGSGRIFCLDIGNDPTAPTSLGSVASASLNLITQAYLAGNLLYCARQGTGIAVVDVEDPTAPTFKFTFSTPDNPQGAALAGRHWYQVGAATSTFSVTDLRTGQVPSLTAGSVAADSVLAHGDLQARNGVLDSLNVGQRGILCSGDLAVTGALVAAGGTSSGNVVTVSTTPYTVLSTDSVILVDASGGARTVNLPAAASSNRRELVVKKIDSSANAVTIDGSGLETIDGAATQALASQWDSLRIKCNGTAWFIV